MALIRMGALVTRISGKIGGQTLGTGPAGSYIKNTGTPRKSITLKQRSKMALMATTAQRWRTLSAEKRLMFNAASPEYTYLNRVGETKNYSGYAIFTQLANNVFNTFSDSSSPPIPIPLPRVSFLLPVLDRIMVFGNEVNVQISNTSATFIYRVFASRPSSFGVSSPYKNKFYIQNLDSDGSESTGELNEGIVAKFGIWPKSTITYFRVDMIHPSTGQSLKGALSFAYNKPPLYP